ncbi:hypothetical protein RI129_007219 [Pyrocoelia pectoralis]|uniref:Uncharacterized protein n=1 Tax=Pyrocoelia pectoralis TaxID=417401 RepID=A0AAN7VBY6_9COLE
MMISSLIILAGLVCIGECGLITHNENGADHHSAKATSYQSFHMEHFHAVPTYIKKEFNHLLEQPLSVGKTESNVEVQHGEKYDHAIANNHNSVHDTPLDEPSSYHTGNAISDGHQYEAYEANAEAASDGKNEEGSYLGYSNGDEGVGHNSPAAGDHYQPTMYVLQYQNENSDGQEQEH